MGVIKRGILGGFSNKVANVVGSSWKGIAVIKSLPLSVANPKTAGQVTQRSKFSQASKFGSAILGNVVKPFWDRFAQQASGYNDFMRTNIENFNQGSDPDMNSMIMSNGSLTNVEDFALDGAIGVTSAQVQWTDNTGAGNSLGTDLVQVVAFKEDGTYLGQADFMPARSVQTVEVSITQAPTIVGDTIYFYCIVKRPDGSIVSDTVVITGTRA